ncbi:MgtC/SapB family protein [Cytobacillus sp. FJAT-54145]|uniref:MgtC/SapB family protein n=1 Tax=Cytobacillus spartinae TaxID=3299023 RepID=A0ABW6K8A7_9BACI
MGAFIFNRGERKITITISTLTILERLFLAALLGGLIGWERDLRNKQAGFKTHLLVSVGSALIMILSIYGFNETINHINARFDPARLAHGVISGIGFLGAGAILRHSNNLVTGITTAATLWVVAAIGLSVGSGFYLPALITTGIVLINVFLLRSLEFKFLIPKKYVTISLVVSEEAKVLGKVNKLLKNESAVIKGITMSDEYYFLDEGFLSFDIDIKLSTRKNILLISQRLSALEGVKQVKIDNINVQSPQEDL